MALDDVVKAAKKARGAEVILNSSTQDAGFNAGREMAVYDGIDPSDPALQLMSSNSPVWHREYAQRAVSEYQERVIDASQANLPDVFGAYSDSKKAAGYLINRKPVTTGQPIDPIHEKAFKAYDALRDEKSIEKFLSSRIADLNGKAVAGKITRATAGAMSFVYTQNPKLAEHALMDVANKAGEELKNALNDPKAYIEARYNAMSDDDKKGEAYALAVGLK